jgi:S-adenosyl-L-methionine hydrolase (adenosine-forming)
MSIITLTTEWNTNNYYIGAVKGAIIAACKDAMIIDISHQIPAYNYLQAAFIIRSCYKNFPDGTVHMLCVRSFSSDKYPFLVIKYDSHYFITANNGIADILFDKRPQKIYSIDIFGHNSIFPELYIMAKAAAFLAKGNNINEIGLEITDIIKPFLSFPAISDDSITGTIIHIDSYKNAITDISESLFNEVGKGRPFEILLSSTRYKTKTISKNYYEKGECALITLFNSIGLLEVALCYASASELLFLEVSNNIRITFK